MSYTEENDVELTDLYDDEITDEDYGFVFGPDGSLKSIFMPTEWFEVPENILRILKMHGIPDPETIYEGRVLH